MEISEELKIKFGLSDEQCKRVLFDPETVGEFAMALCFTGESMSGKSTVAACVKEFLEAFGIKCAYPKKYIAREKRQSGEDPNVVIVEEVPDNCLKGNANGNEFGYDVDEIKQMIKNGIFPIIITKDLEFLSGLYIELNGDEFSKPNENIWFKNCRGEKQCLKTAKMYTLRMSDGYAAAANNSSRKRMETIIRERQPNITDERLMAEMQKRNFDNSSLRPKCFWQTYENLSIFSKDCGVENYSLLAPYIMPQFKDYELDPRIFYNPGEPWCLFDYLNTCALCLKQNKENGNLDNIKMSNLSQPIKIQNFYTNCLIEELKQSLNNAKLIRGIR